jgi:hypothetical protein
MKPGCEDLIADSMATPVERHRLDSKNFALEKSPESTNNDNDETMLPWSQSLSEGSRASHQEVLFVGNSMQTETTHPFPYSDRTIDT